MLQICVLDNKYDTQMSVVFVVVLQGRYAAHFMAPGSRMIE